jgi:hypothetical protein
MHSKPSTTYAHCLRRFQSTSTGAANPRLSHAGAAKLSTRRLIAIHGQDAPHFLQGITTNNIRPGQTKGLYSTFLTATVSFPAEFGMIEEASWTQATLLIMTFPIGPSYQRRLHLPYISKLYLSFPSYKLKMLPRRPRILHRSRRRSSLEALQAYQEV